MTDDTSHTDAGAGPVTTAVTDTIPDGPDPDGERSRSAARQDTTDLLVDLGLTLALAAVALVGLRSVLDGSGWLVIGLVGALAGAAAAELSHRRRLAAPMTLVVLAAAFVLLGSVATPDRAIAGFLPGPGVPGALLTGLVRAWKYVVTTTPPVTVRDGIGVIPYVFGFVTVGFGLLLARRTDQPALPAVPGVVMLGLGILLGTERPVSVLLQGAFLTLLVLVWGAIRANRPRRSTDGLYWPRIIAGALMIAGVTVAASVLAGSLPLTAGARTVARDELIPPFDPSSHASPLAGYRQLKVGRSDDVLFRAEGLPSRSRVRLAVMDRYDGVVWSVGGSDVAHSGRFVHVGRRLPDAPAGRRTSISLTVRDHRDIWVPVVDHLVSMRFGGDDAGRLEDSFRYNHQTRTAASTTGLDEGDRFDFEIDHPDLPTPDDIGDRPFEPLPFPDLPEDEAARDMIAGITVYASDILDTPDTSHAHAQMEALAATLRDTGHFANGGAEEKREHLRSRSGHSLGRLTRMIEADQLVGDAEQYAALLGVMARSLGFPARVVLGFDVEKGGDLDLTGDDLTAWVEVKFEGIDEWIPFDPTPPEDRVPEEQPKLQQQDTETRVQPPPPERYVDPPPEVDPQAGESSKSDEIEAVASSGSGIPAVLVTLVRWGGPPIGLVLAVVGGILGLKGWRRRRRRTRGTASRRANGAWLEAVDTLRDHGHETHPSATRAEIARAARDAGAWEHAPLLATAVDAVMFGPGEPEDERVEEIWSALDREVRGLRRPLPFGRRLRVALSLASFRSGRTSERPPILGLLVSPDGATFAPRAVSSAGGPNEPHVPPGPPRPPGQRGPSSPPGPPGSPGGASPGDRPTRPPERPPGR